MRELFFCLNQVSYVLATEYLASQPALPGAIRFDTRRVRPLPRFKRLQSAAISPGRTVCAAASAIVAGPTRAWVPHERTGRLIQWCARACSETALVDDGMDTLRDVPKNLDPAGMPRVSTLLTFADYRVVGRWATGLQRIAGAALVALADDDRPAFDLRPYRTVIVESPGVAAAQRFAGDYALYVPHPSPIKRLAPPPACSIFPGHTHSLEKSLLSFRGRVVIGETMLLPFLLAARHDGLRELIVTLTRHQYGNLTALHGDLVAAGVSLELA
jgi:hypothetical protein